MRDGHLVGEQPAFPGGVPGHAAPDDRPGLPHKAQVDGAAARGLAPEAVDLDHAGQPGPLRRGGGIGVVDAPGEGIGVVQGEGEDGAELPVLAVGPKIEVVAVNAPETGFDVLKDRGIVGQVQPGFVDGGERH